MKKFFNAFNVFLKKIAKGFHFWFLWLEYLLLYWFVNPFFKCKVIGKKNVNKSDEARVFVANHYEIYGPVAIFLRFPYKFRPWVIDKIMQPESVEQQMSISIYNNFDKYPIWFKKLSIKFLKNLMVFTMHHAKAICVSRENPKTNIQTMRESCKTLNTGTSIVIFPEESYVNQGVGKFFTGFEYLAKYYYKKTGKKISFYPVFISKQNKKMYIEKQITYNPNNDNQFEQNRIINYLQDTMINSYIKNECGKPIKIKK